MFVVFLVLLVCYGHPPAQSSVHREAAQVPQRGAQIPAPGIAGITQSLWLARLH